MTVLRRSLFALFLAFPLSLFAQSADQEVVSAVDSPDPVTPGSTLTYTVTLTNHGPDAAVNGGVNINLPGAVTHQSSVGPAGFSCNYLGSNGTCNTPSLAPGTYVLTINVTVNPSLAAFPDQSISATFFPSGTTPDPNSANNSKTAMTLVDSPQVDLSLTATDSPDPVFPDGTIKYTVDLTNSGPDSASSVNFNVVPNASLAFQSVTVPAGWSCVPPSAGALNATFTCSRAVWAPGSSQFVIEFSANDENLGINDTSLNTYFGVFAGASDETDDGQDNDETETTQYTTPDADMTVSVSDSPDPVTPDGNIIYTVTVGNTGPDTSSNVVLSAFGSNNLRFQSATVPAGWNCTLPAANAQTAGFSCTLASMASGASSVLTFVLQATDELIGINDATIQFGFSVSSSVSDPDNTDNSETESTAYVTPDADMTVAASDSPDPVSANNDITYTVTVGNSGPDAATNAQLSVSNSGTLRFQSATVPAGWNCSLPSLNATPTFTCTNPSFANGGSSIFTIVARADSSLLGLDDGTVETAFTVSSTVADPDNTDNSETEATAYLAPDADLSVTATDAPDPVAPDGEITYTVTVVNGGPDAAAATLTVPMSNGLTFTSITTPAGFNCSGVPAPGNASAFTCTNANMPATANAVFTIVLHAGVATFGHSDQTIVQSFSVASNIDDPDGSDNSVDVSTQYDAVNADAGVTAADAPDPVVAGNNLTYSGAVTNGGPDPAGNVTLSATLAPELLFQSLTGPAGFVCSTPAVGTNGAISCSIATLPSGASIPFTLVVQVDPALALGPGGVIGQTFTVTTTSHDPTSSNDSVTSSTTYAPTSADLAISNSDAPDPVEPGATITYTQMLTNNGPDPATTVQITQSTPTGTTFQSFAAPGGWSCTQPAAGGTGAIECTKAVMANGEVATFTLVVVVTGSGTITSTVNADAATGDPDTRDNAATASTQVGPARAVLSLTKTTGAALAEPGSVIDYLITVSNAGPSAATNVTVNDTLPATLEFISATPSQGTCNAVSPIVCGLGTVPAGASATVTISTRVVAPRGSIANTASVSSAEGGTASSTTPAIVISAAEAIPTLSEWALLALAALLGLAAAMRARG